MAATKQSRTHQALAASGLLHSSDIFSLDRSALPSRRHAGCGYVSAGVVRVLLRGQWQWAGEWMTMGGGRCGDRECCGGASIHRALVLSRILES
jgi:hypothetical protein